MATLNTQHSTLNTQHSTLNTQHSTLNTQHNDPISQDRWYSGFFFSSEATYPFMPDQMAPLFKSEIGFRATAGYTYKNMSFGIESGFFSLSGISMNMFSVEIGAIVERITFVPILATFSYDFILFNRLHLTPKVSFGAAFSKTIHYISIFDLLQKKSQNTFDTGVFASLQARVGFALIPQNLIIYVAGGVDLMPESSVGLIPLPTIHAGIVCYPVKIVHALSGIARQSKEKKTPPAEAQTAPAQTPQTAPATPEQVAPLPDDLHDETQTHKIIIRR